jgi:hypothetical protein
MVQLQDMLKSSVAVTEEDHSEIARIWDFFQEFVNEQGLFKTRILNFTDISTREKMDAIEWVVRNIEFISPKIIEGIIDLYKEILSVPNSPLKQSLTTTKHCSDIVAIIIKYIQENV